jgi:hypothetical protein
VKIIGKFGLLICIILAIIAGLNACSYFWAIPIIVLQTLSYYFFRFKNLKFKTISKRNNPFIKEFPYHLINQSFIVLIAFTIGFGLNTFSETENYTSLSGQIKGVLDAVSLSIEAMKQAISDLYCAILQSRFN